MKKYKEDLQQFQLQEDEKQALKDTLRQQASTSKKKHFPYLQTACCLLLLLGGTFLLYPQLFPQDKKQEKELSIKQPINYEQLYKPQNYQSFGGMGSSTTFIDFLNTSKNQFHPITKDITINTLPVYEYDRVRELKKEFERFDDAEYQKWINEVATKLQIDTPLLTGEHDTIYFLNTASMTLEIKENGTIRMQSNETCEESINKQPQELLTLAKKYFKQYQKATDILNPIYRIDYRNGYYEVLIAEQSSNRPDSYDENKIAIFSIEIEYNQINEDISVAYHPTLSLPLQEHQEHLGEFPIMHIDEAVKVLLQGGYTCYRGPNESFTSANIAGWELKYSDDHLLNYLPYRIPIYRFYVKTETDTYILDVVAIKTTALTKLDKVNWYESL